MGAYLPPGEKLKLYIDVENRKLSVALVRHQEEHYALSGSTEARVLAALACGMFPAGSIIPLDDRMWSKPTLGKTLKALAKAPHQVVVPTTIAPTASQSKGWSVLAISRTQGEGLNVEKK